MAENATSENGENFKTTNDKEIDVNYKDDKQQDVEKVCTTYGENKELLKVQNTYENDFDVYNLISDKIKEALETELSLDEFKEKFNVNKTQASEWLNRAIADGYIKKIYKPVRYKTI